MPILSLDNLSLYSSSYYNYKAFLKGKALFEAGQARVTAFDGPTAICEVFDGRNTCAVGFKALTKRDAQATCDCPECARELTCQHKTAAYFALHEYIDREAKNQWQYRIQQALETMPRRKSSSGPRSQYAVLFGLTEQVTYNEVHSFHLVPYRIKGAKWNGVDDLDKLADRQEQNARLDRDRTWVHSVEFLQHAAGSAGCGQPAARGGPPV